MPGAAVPSSQTTPWTLPSLDRRPVESRVDALVGSRVASKAVLILAATVLAFGLRATALSTYGFSEDEINKVRAIEQYREGHFVANAEHPMLMKLAMWASLEVTRAWNRVAPAGQSVAMETAIRLPNALVGAATTAALFGMCELLFGTRVAIVASLLWAVDVNAIAINRIGKEDTFALFFFVLAIWCYERAKRQGVVDPGGAQRWYTRSGASFGLMLASKYFLQYLGIYALFNSITDLHPGANRPKKLRYYGAMLVTFLVANTVVLAPAAWQYCLRYVQGGTLMHHGQAFAGHLYVNSVLVSPHGVPGTFYLRLLVTKVPVAALGATIAGLIETVRRRRERGFILIQTWLLLLIVPYSLLAPKFLRYALPLFAALDIVAAVGVVAGIAWLMRKSWLAWTTRVTVSMAALLVSVAGPFLAQQSAAPFYSLFRNAIGERLAPPAATFPEETYDYGVREAVGAIVRSGTPSAVIVSDAPGVVGYYVGTSSRQDLRVRSLSAQGLPPGDQPAWVIVQGEHVTFENRDVIARLQRQSIPWRELYAGDALAARVFRIPRS